MHQSKDDDEKMAVLIEKARKLREMASELAARAEELTAQIEEHGKSDAKRKHD
jgi:hypothetical protein